MMSDIAVAKPATPVEPQSAAQVTDVRARTFFIACAASSAAHLAALYALFLLAVDSAASTVFVALFLAAVAGGQALGLPAAPVAGVLPRKFILVIGNVLQAAVCFLVLRLGASSWSVYTAALALATVHQYGIKAEAGALPSLAGQAQAGQATRWRYLAGSLGRMLGGLALASLTMSRAGPETALTLSGLLLLFAAALYLSVRHLTPPNGPGRRYSTIPMALRQSWDVFRGPAGAAQVAAESALAMAAMAMLVVLAPRYVQAVLGAGPSALFLLLAPYVIGGVVGFLLASLASRGAAGVAVTAGFYLLAAALVGLAFVHEISALEPFADSPIQPVLQRAGITPAMAMAMAFAAVCGLADSVVITAAHTVLRWSVPREGRDQVDAAHRLIASLLAGLPVLVVAALADYVDVRLLVLAVMLVMVLCSLYLRLASGISDGDSDDADQVHLAPDIRKSPMK